MSVKQAYKIWTSKDSTIVFEFYEFHSRLEYPILLVLRKILDHTSIELLSNEKYFGDMDYLECISEWQNWIEEKIKEYLTPYENKK